VRPVLCWAPRGTPPYAAGQAACVGHVAEHDLGTAAYAITAAQAAQPGNVRAGCVERDWQRARLPNRSGRSSLTIRLAATRSAGLSSKADTNAHSQPLRATAVPVARCPLTRRDRHRNRPDTAAPRERRIADTRPGRAGRWARVVMCAPGAVSARCRVLKMGSRHTGGGTAGCCRSWSTMLRRVARSPSPARASGPTGIDVSMVDQFFGLQTSTTSREARRARRSRRWDEDLEAKGGVDAFRHPVGLGRSCAAARGFLGDVHDGTSWVVAV
jgi:hypothetical protein